MINAARMFWAALIAATSISLMPHAVQASNKATLFPFRSHMAAEGNCEGAAWKAGEKLGEWAYASWDGKKRIIWIGINGKVYQSSIQRTEAGRVKVVEGRFGDVDAIISISQQANYNPDSAANGTLELLSRSTNQSYGRINVSVAEAC